MIDDAKVEKMRWDIVRDFHAANAAKELLSWACFYIQTGQPAPQALRNIIADGLEHLEWNSPLLAFGHIYKQRQRRGRPGKESEYELTHVLRDILLVHREGFPLTGERERWPFKRLDGTAFMEYSRRKTEGNDVAVKKEARRLQAAFWKRIRGLPVAQQESLGVASFLPRKK